MTEIQKPGGGWTREWDKGDTGSVSATEQSLKDIRVGSPIAEGGYVSGSQKNRDRPERSQIAGLVRT